VAAAALESAGISGFVQLAGTSGVEQQAVAGIFEVGQFALLAGTSEVGIEAGFSVELAVALAVAVAAVAAVAAAAEVKDVAAVAHEVSVAEADLHHIAQPVGSVVHGREK